MIATKIPCGEDYIYYVGNKQTTMRTKFQHVKIKERGNLRVVSAVTPQGTHLAELEVLEVNQTDKEILQRLYGISIIIEAMSTTATVRFNKRAYAIKLLPDVDNLRENTWLFALSEPIIVNVAGCPVEMSYVVIYNQRDTVYVHQAWPTGTLVSEPYHSLHNSSISGMLNYLKYEFIGPPLLAVKIEPEISSDFSARISSETAWITEFAELSNNSYVIVIENFATRPVVIQQRLEYYSDLNEWHLVTPLMAIKLPWWVAKFVAQNYLDFERVNLSAYADSAAYTHVDWISHAICGLTINEFITLYATSNYGYLPDGVAFLFTCIDWGQLSSDELFDHLIDWLVTICN